jgi:hypothetical protein
MDHLTLVSWGNSLLPRSEKTCQPLLIFVSPQALEKLQFLYLADNLLDSIPWPLPLSLRSLHLQVRSLSQSRGGRQLGGGRQVGVGQPGE